MGDINAIYASCNRIYSMNWALQLKTLLKEHGILLFSFNLDYHWRRYDFKYIKLTAFILKYQFYKGGNVTLNILTRKDTDIAFVLSYRFTEKNCIILISIFFFSIIIFFFLFLLLFSFLNCKKSYWNDILIDFLNDILIDILINILMIW